MDDPIIPSVTSDEEDGVRRMLTHLAALGHRRVCAIAGDQSISTGQRRHEAFCLFAPDLGIELQAGGIAFASDFNESAGERCMEELLARGIEFTAVHCANDRLAIGAISALRRRGLNCPADISVTGFNDMPMVDRIDPPLTTIRIQQHKVGFVAAELLHEQMRELVARPVSQHIVLPVDLIVRASTAPPRKSSAKPARQTRRA